MKRILIISLLIMAIALTGAYSEYGSPSEFGNESTTTVWIGGDDGELNITGTATIDGNVTASTGFFSYLGSLLNRITKLWVGDIDAFGNINASGNISTAQYFSGQPIEGSIGSGIISADRFLDPCGCMNVTDNGGLQVTYPAHVHRIVNSNGAVNYCSIPEASVSVADNQHSIYYVDSSCVVQSNTFVNYYDFDITPGDYSRMFDVYTSGGDIESLKAATLIELTDRKSRRLNVECGSSGHLAICDGIDIAEDVFPYFNQTVGHFNYINTMVATTLQDVENDGLHFVYRSGGTWTHADGTGINLSSCDDGTDLVSCSPTPLYRRYFIGTMGWGDHTKVHQLAAFDTETFTNVGNCLDITANPLTDSYTIPPNDVGVFILHHVYCGRASDSDWTGAWIDLRASNGLGGGTADTSPFLTRDGARSLTANWNAVFNITADYFFGNLNSSGTSYLADADFNGGWLNDGVSIINGNIYAQTGYFYNITSLNVTKQNLTVIDNLIVDGNVTASYYFGDGSQLTNILYNYNQTYILGTYNSTYHKWSYNQTSNVYWNVSGTNLFPSDLSKNVGIGTITPNYKLDVRSAMAITAPNYQIRIIDTADDTQQWRIGTAADTDLAFYRNATELMRIEDGGNVGIGTSGPLHKLQVDGLIGAFAMPTFETETEVIRFGRIDSPTIRYHSITSEVSGAVGGGGNYLKFKLHDATTTTSQINIMTLRGDGNVGIGTNSPGATLDVNGDVEIGTMTSSNTATLSVQSDSNHRAIHIEENDSQGESWQMGVDVDGDLNFHNSGASPLIAFADGGNVGIGTASPLAKFTIKSSSLTNDGGLRIIKSTTDANYYDNYINTAGDLNWAYTGTDIVTFKSDGNVGIGTSSPSSKLHVVGDLNVTGNYIHAGSIGFTGTCINTTYSGGIAISCND